MENTTTYEDKYNYYVNLTKLNYSEAIESLINKHGEAQDDYYNEKSYAKYLNGEIKSITKGKTSRTSEGLYCHHILENEYQNISQKGFIFENQYPFEYQKKENLVYCDLIEHLILHAIISKETNGEYGLPGFLVFLMPNFEDWYIKEVTPTRNWEINCKNRGFLPKEYATSLLIEIEEIVKNVDGYQDAKKEVKEMLNR